MATLLSVGDIAIVQYNSSTTDSFTFVFTRDVEAGTVVNFTDNGWLAAGGFRAGEGTLTYTAAAAVTAGTIVTLTGLNLDDAGDQIIAYQGDPATPTILYLVDLADGNNTVAGDATNDNTTALPPGLTLGVNAVAVGFDNAIYAGPNSGSPAELSRAVSNSANWINSDSLATVFKIVERPDIDLDADNSTTGGSSYRAFVTSGGAAVKIADSDIDISDLDGDAIFAAEIHIRGADFGDVLSVNGALPTGITASLDPLTGVLTLSGEASHDAYEAAIRQIEFSTTQPIGTQTRIDVSVFDGEEWGPEAKAFITVGNSLEATAAPVLDLDANDSNGVGADYTATFASGGPEIPVADTDVSITDADSAAIESATITLAINREPEDVLSFTGPAGPITAAYDSAAGILTLTGSATLAEYQTALRQVVFSTTSTSTADRIIQATVNDGTFDSNVGTTLMHVVANVPPALNLDADSSTIGGVDYLTTFVDGGPAVAIVDTDVLITDSDDIELTSATVTLTNPHTDDVLVFNGTPPTGIAASLYDPLTGILTLTGTASLAAYQTALRQIRFDHTGTTPSTDTRIIDVVVNDGTAASNLAHAIIEVAQVNNTAPVVDLDADDSTVVGTSFLATFTEGGAPIPIADIDTLITDTDSTTLASATITLTDPQAGDLLTATGSLPPGITASAYNPVTGTLTLSNVASFADYETALEAIRFSAAGDNPVAGNRIIQVVVNDGIDDSQPATSLVTVVAVNDPPINTVPGGQTVAEDTTLSIAGVSVADIDSSALTTTLSVANGILNVTAGAGVTGNGTASVTIAGTATEINTALVGLAYTGNLDFNGADTLTVATSDATATDTDTIAITVNPVNDAPINTVPGAQSVDEDTILPIAGVLVADIDSSALTTTLSVAHGILNVTASPGAVVTGNGTDSVIIAGTAAQINAALAGLAYTGNLDFHGADTLTVATSDGTAIDTDTIAITVNAVNDPPVLNLDANSSTIGGVDYLTTFTGSAVTIVDTDVSVVDNDSPLLALATVTLTNPQAFDSLTFNGPAPGSISVSGSGTSEITLTSTGAASAADYQAALQQITFDAGTNPSTETRIIDVVVNDGTVASNLAHAIIEVTQVNNTAPVVNLDADDSTVVGTSFRATFTEGGAPIPIADVDTMITDTDSTTLASATITLTDPQAGDLLAASGALAGGIMASSYDPGTGILTLSGVASLADYETALEAIRFSAAGENPVAGSRIVEVVVNDGANNSQAVTALLTVVAVNDASALVVADANYQENAPPVLLSPSASLTDADDTELNFAAVQITAGSFPGDGDTLTIGGATSGTVTGITFLWNPTLHALELTGASSPANYQALLQTVAFQSASDNPTDFDASPQRTLTWSVSDGTAVTTATTTIDIVAVNDAPQETIAATAAYTENGSPVTISPAATASDVDNTDLVSGVVRIAGGWVDGDFLTVNGLQSGTFSGIEFSYNADLHALVFSHPAPVADFQALMQAVQFGSTSENPTNFGANPTRTLGWGLHDGDDYSSPVQTTIVTITALNDPPINTVPGGQTVAEDTILPIAGVSVADIDSSALTTTLSVAHGILNVTAGAGVTGNGTDSVTIAGTATEINTALAGLAYAGNPDFHGGDTVTVATSDGTATDTDTIAITVNATIPPWIFIASGDFNGDGTDDVLWQDPSTGGTIEWLMSPNGGVGSIPSTPATGGWDVIATGDFNGDGIQDLMWKTDAGGITSEWLMSPNGGIGSNPDSIPATPGWDVIATGDFNGDGIQDLMWKTAAGGITSEWLMSPNGGIGSNPDSIPATPGWDVIATGDFNGDGTTDIMWKTAAGGITSEWLMSPNGGILSNPDGIPATAGWDVIATGDFNGDGTTDIMWKTGTGGITSEWLMSPNGGILSNPDSIPATAGWDVIATGDFNGDGTTDIMWKTGTGGITSEWLMSPNGGILSNPDSIPATAGWDVIATGDFNGDGTTDIMWKTGTGGITSEWLMSPNGGILSNPDSIPATPGWDVFATGVFNGDGTTDVFWKTAPGLTSEWLMSAGGGIGSNPPTPVAAGTIVHTVTDFPFV